MELQNITVIALIGTVAGILGGMLGLGGAIIIIPALVMLLVQRETVSLNLNFTQLH